MLSRFRTFTFQVKRKKRLEGRRKKGDDSFRRKFLIKGDPSASDPITLLKKILPTKSSKMTKADLGSQNTGYYSSKRCNCLMISMAERMDNRRSKVFARKIINSAFLTPAPEMDNPIAKKLKRLNTHNAFIKCWVRTYV